MQRFISLFVLFFVAHAVKIALISLITLSIAAPLQAETPLSTAIRFSRTSMKLNNTLLNGTFDVRFKVFDAATGGNQIGPTLTKTGLAITGGKLPTQTLDFGNDVFNGNARWIEVRARQGGNPFAPVGSRNKIFAVPYALALPGLYTQQNDSCPNIIGGYAGNSVSPEFIGQTISGGGGNGVENTVSGEYGTVAGGRDNTAAVFATVSGGVSNVADGIGSTIGGGNENTTANSLSTVGGGTVNSATGTASTIGGGNANQASGTSSVIAGGFENSAVGSSSVIGGGSNNFASGTTSSVGGGVSNLASGSSSTASGGTGNTASGSTSTVGGGANNTASGSSSTVAGGSSNTASGSSSVVPGGQSCAASGNFSFAAGRRAKAAFQGAFTWADSTNTDFGAGAPDSFNIRASGGVFIFSNSNTSAGVFLAPGAGAWSSVSDRAMKTNIQPINTRDALNKVLNLPISTWNYTSQNESIRHIGPMAQDFHAAFGFGESDKHITTIDADGVALAAIQGLHELIIEKDAQISTLTTRIERLEALLNTIANSKEHKP